MCNYQHEGHVTLNKISNWLERWSASLWSHFRRWPLLHDAKRFIRSWPVLVWELGFWWTSTIFWCSTRGWWTIFNTANSSIGECFRVNWQDISYSSSRCSRVGPHCVFINHDKIPTWKEPIHKYELNNVPLNSWKLNCNFISIGDIKPFFVYNVDGTHPSDYPWS